MKKFKKNSFKINLDWLYDLSGKKIGIVLKFKDFEKLMDKLEDLHDLYELYSRKKKSTEVFSLEQVKEELFKKNEK